MINFATHRSKLCIQKQTKKSISKFRKLKFQKILNHIQQKWSSLLKISSLSINRLKASETSESEAQVHQKGTWNGKWLSPFKEPVHFLPVPKTLTQSATQCIEYTHDTASRISDYAFCKIFEFWKIASTCIQQAVVWLVSAVTEIEELAINSWRFLNIFSWLKLYSVF